MASNLPPSFGIHQECATSWATISSVTVVSSGTTICLQEKALSSGLSFPVRIRVTPEVLLAVDADVQRLAVGRRRSLGLQRRRHAVGQREAVGAGVGRVADVAQLDERQHAEDHEDHGGADRPADLQAGVAADLRRDGALARAELEQRVEERGLDPDEDHDGDGQDVLVERVDVVRVGRPTRLGREQVGRRGRRAGQEQCRGAQRREREQPRATGSGRRRAQGGWDSMHWARRAARRWRRVSVRGRTLCASARTRSRPR